MEGYILLDERGKKLTHKLSWSSNEHAGWLWNAEEVDEILGAAVHWEHQPTYFQHCQLVEADGDVNVYALDEVKAL